MDEYDVLLFFAAGVVTQGALIARSPKRLGWVAAILAGSVVTAWFVSDGVDRAFDVPVLGVLLFALGFAIVFRDSIMPRITVRLLLHYTLLFYYMLALQIRVAEVTMPRSMIVVGLLPAVAVLALAVLPGSRGRRARTLSYVWFLVVLTTLIGGQFSVEDVKAIVETQGFSLNLMAYAFLAGTAFLYFASNVFHLLLVTPQPRRRTRFLDSVLGDPDDVQKEYAEAMARRITLDALPPLAILLLFVHGFLLFANYRADLLSHGLVINASIALVIWGLEGPGTTGRITHDPSREDPVVDANNHHS